MAVSRAARSPSLQKRGDLPGQPDRGRQRSAGRNEPVHQPDPDCFLGGYAAAGE
jgi:hypothetical protein